MPFDVASGIDYSHVIKNFKSIWNICSGVHTNINELTLDLVCLMN